MNEDIVYQIKMTNGEEIMGTFVSKSTGRIVLKDVLAITRMNMGTSVIFLMRPWFGLSEIKDNCNVHTDNIIGSKVPYGKTLEIYHSEVKRFYEEGYQVGTLDNIMGSMDDLRDSDEMIDYLESLSLSGKLN